MTTLLSSLVERLRARGVGIAKLQELHPTIDHAVRRARRTLYTHRFFREGPRKRGAPGGRTFVVFNHCYDLDVDALCAADSPHAVWVLDPFALFTDVAHYFPPEQRDINCIYGAGEMRESIARFKAAYVSDLARRLVREIKLDGLIAPSDTFYYLRPLIEELHGLGVPTIVQDKEGTIAPSPIMVDHAQRLAARYPPIADRYYFWNDTCAAFWRGIGVPDAKIEVLGQPRSDFFFHADRWPSKTELGLGEHKRLVVIFTYDSDAYLRVTDPIPNGPWQAMRDELHDAVRQLARERDDIEVVVKAHPQQTELADVIAEFASHAVPNVHVMSGARSASHLLVRADVIVGFQSTVMIEAMLTDKPVIYAGWGGVHERHSATLIPIHLSGGCTRVDGRADLDRKLRDALDGRLAPSAETKRARKAFTDRYFWDADGRASQRILAAAAAFVGR